MKTIEKKYDRRAGVSWVLVKPVLSPSEAHGLNRGLLCVLTIPTGELLFVRKKAGYICYSGLTTTIKLMNGPDEKNVKLLKIACYYDLFLGFRARILGAEDLIFKGYNQKLGEPIFAVAKGNDLDAAIKQLRSYFDTNYDPEMSDLRCPHISLSHHNILIAFL